MKVFPEQMIPMSEKDDKWRRSVADYLIDLSLFSSDNELDELYNAAQGKLDKSAYKYVLNPYNSKDENILNYPAQMRNYDIIMPILKLFLGEKSRRPNNPQVIVTNSDVTNNFKDELNKVVINYVSQNFINQLNQQGIDTGVPTQEMPELEKVIQDHKDNWNDQRAIFGQEALDYIKYNCELSDKFQDGLYNYLVTGRVVSFKEPLYDDVHYEIVSSRDVRFGPSSTKFGEDADWVVRRDRISINACIDRFRSYLTESEINELKELSKGPGEPTPNIIYLDHTGRDRKFDMYYDSRSGLIDLWHFQWKSFRKIGYLTYLDEIGKEQQDIVDENYVFSKENGDVKIEWEYISQSWEGYRLGSKIYVKIEPLNAERSDLNNISIVKLYYNYVEDKFPSPVKLLIPYQALYNIYHYRAELTLARNKDKIMLMPKGLLPPGWEPDKAMYFAESTGMLWFDESRPNAAQILQAIRGIDMGLGNYVAEMRNLLAGIKEESWDAVGMNRQRYGDSMASDGKSTTEQAIFRSSMITEEMFRNFEKFEEKEYLGLIDISKIAWQKGKKGMYITSDGRKAFFEVNEIIHSETNYGIFVRNNSNENEKLQSAKQIAYAMAQKGARASLTLEMIDSNNFSRIKSLVAKVEKEMSEAEERFEKVKQEVMLHQEEIKAKSEDKKLQVEIYKADKIYDAAIDSATIKAQGAIAFKSGTEEEANENIDEVLENRSERLSKETGKMMLENMKIDLQSAKDSANIRLKETDQRLKEKDIEMKKYVAKTNKN